MDCHSVCVCVRDCYAFHSVYVMPPVKFACAQGSGNQIGATGFRISSQRGRKDVHLLKTPTRGDSQSSVPLRILRILRLRKVLSDISCLTINISGSDPNRSRFLDCNNQLDHPLELSVIA